jgi:hypothetical protein
VTGHFLSDNPFIWREQEAPLLQGKNAQEEVIKPFPVA